MMRVVWNNNILLALMLAQPVSVQQYLIALKAFGFSVRPIAQFRPKTDFVEQSSADIWQQVCTTVKRVGEIISHRSSM